MFKNNKILCVIPARGGSKRLKNKNILNFNKKPLIFWTIKPALRSKYIDQLIVSTDSKKIMNVSRKFNVDVPFLRPKKISSKNSTVNDVALHSIKFYQKQSIFFDTLIILQPTSPLRTTKLIDEAILYYFKKKASSVVSVAKLDHPTEWCNVLPSNDRMDNFLNSNIKNTQSQNFKQKYKLNGSIYIVDIKKFIEEKNLYLKKNMYAFRMDESLSIDIDDKLSFDIAEFIFKQKNFN
tara:strand:- start:2781 stop:3491 length:711 start_codon:yes stop_codon:yes gene_type:complete